ncbi:DUF262 domain-containing HNH endonuclease family protein [Deinococcus sp. VB343]|uniref:DUF262 domain-containing HNH endonuclease family protein n=1 Tax=Deinococcus sp. VB142 TaxID=3112952 RepID=A0AAU6PZG4_9DEIO
MTQIVRGINSYTASVGDVLRKSVTYIVPEYQRDYSWTQEEIDELWNDITGAATRPNDDYFMGAIVISPSSKKDSWDIVDGQQRLTTLSIIFSVIQKQWKIMDDDRHVDIRRDYLGDRDRETKEFKPKIKLNASNDDIYRDVVIDHKVFAGLDLKAINKSNKLIVQSFNAIEIKLNNWLSQKKDRQSALIEIEKFISNRLKLIVIEAVSDYDAYLIFETLNDRGLDLAVSDLVKNHLFRLGGSQLEDFKRKWLEINTLVGSDLKPFLRHFWISENQLISEKDLYKNIREKISSHTSARGFMSRLHKGAVFYSAISNQDHELWNDYPDSIREDLAALDLFRVSQFKPIVLAAMDKFTPSEVAKAVRLLLVISVRYSVVSKLSTGNLEKVYGAAVQGINSGRVKNSKDLFNEIKSLYVEDVRFKDNIVSLRFDKPSISRYFLAKICENMSGEEEKTVLHSGKATLEHIMPQSQMEFWGINQNEADDYINHIGNLTLLERRKNQSISNKSFEEKKPTFEKSTLIINSIIASKGAWGIDEIIERGQILADAATKIWRFET